MDHLDLFLQMDVSLQAIVPHRDAVIALAADRLTDNSGISYERVKAALRTRENLGSTAVGEGVAMPHGTSRYCRRPACAFIGLSDPVEFDAPDGRDVDTVFALVWPQNDPQGLVGFLSAASHVLRDPAVISLARKSAAPDLIRSLAFFKTLASENRRARGNDLQNGPYAHDGPKRRVLT